MHNRFPIDCCGSYLNPTYKLLSEVGRTLPDKTINMWLDTTSIEEDRLPILSGNIFKFYKLNWQAMPALHG